MLEIVVATVKFGSGQVAALLCGAIAVKIMAVTIGPAGVGLFSLLRQAQQTLGALATFGGQNAVVQGVASRRAVERDHFMVSVLWVFVAGSTVLGALTVAFAAPLADLIFREDARVGPSVVRWIPFPLAAGALLVYFRSVLNAHMEIGAVAWTNVVTGAAAVALVYPAVLLYQAGLHLALVLLLGGALTLGLTFALHQAWRRGCLASFRRTEIRSIDPKAIRHFLRVGLPSLTALFVGMGSVLVVRAMVARLHGLPAAGQFDSAWSISTLYLAVFLTALHSYLLPALSAQTTQTPRQEVVERALRLGVIVAAPLITSMVILKPLVVQLLYSGEFLPALELLRWTLIGDYLRVASWVLATFLVARADMRAYLACELTWNALFLAGAFWLGRDGFAGAGPAYVGAYGAYLAALSVRTLRHHKIRLPIAIPALWLGGALVVLLASLATWNEVTLVWAGVSLIVVAAALSWFAVTPTEKRILWQSLPRFSLRK